MPAFCAILADVHTQEELVARSNNNETDHAVIKTLSENEVLGAAAIALEEYDHNRGSRVLRIEFLYVDPKFDAFNDGLLSRRLVLRLSSFALTAGCKILRLLSRPSLHC